MNTYVNIKRVLWYIFAGTKGGPTRLKIVELLRKRPFNTNQLSIKLGMDYKTIQHHIKILEENKIIVPSNNKYGAVYFPSQLLEQVMETFEEIKSKINWNKGDGNAV
jgi:predicted transcriptional regulator